ncbi:MAG: Gfo/Idh/MocA family oxidoreductase [bacterium]|nr:Gfo/Idh/MocA family oxidoreductase [bacterium]
MINVGFIGCGRIADLHALGYSDNPRARIYAVCDADSERAEQRKTEWGAEKAYSDYHDMLNDPEVHAVEVLTPYDTHEPIVVAAAAAGKHVACQKPMTTSLASAARMVAAAEEAGIVFKVTEMYVTYPPIALAKSLIQESVYGDPVGMRIKYVASPKGGWDVPASTYEQQFRIAATGHGFETFDHGHHEWAVGWYLLGDVERVAAWVDTVDGIVDTPATIMWKCKDSKRYGTCDFLYAEDLTIPTKYYPNDEWFEVTCTRGIILVNRGTGAIKDGPPVSAFDGEKWTHYDDVPCDWAEGFIAATHNFIAAINGESAALLTAREGEEVLRFALAVERSASKRREVFLDEFDHAFPSWYAWRRRRRERKSCIVGPRPRRWLSFGGATAKYAPQARDLTLGLVDRFDASAVRDWECVLTLHLDAEGGAPDQDFGIYVKDGSVDIRPDDKPDSAILSLRMPAGTWAAILLGKKRLEMALMQGTIKYDGRAEEGLRLRSAFKI